MVLLKTTSIIYHHANNVKAVFPQWVENREESCSGFGGKGIFRSFKRFLDFLERFEGNF